MLRKFLAKTAVVDGRGRRIDFTATVRSMDRSIREELERETVDSDQSFFDRYVEKHRQSTPRRSSQSIATISSRPEPR